MVLLSFGEVIQAGQDVIGRNERGIPRKALSEMDPGNTGLLSATLRLGQILVVVHRLESCDEVRSVALQGCENLVDGCKAGTLAAGLISTEHRGGDFRRFRQICLSQILTLTQSPQGFTNLREI